jgi:hypothetical protein
LNPELPSILSFTWRWLILLLTLVLTLARYQRIRKQLLSTTTGPQSPVV